MNVVLQKNSLFDYVDLGHLLENKNIYQCDCACAKQVLHAN